MKIRLQVGQLEKKVQMNEEEKEERWRSKKQQLKKAPSDCPILCIIN